MPAPDLEWAASQTMMALVIYARFSTDLQKERSIEDQIALCQTHAQLQGARVVAIYHDSARSGASIFGRDGLAKLMEAARERAFEVVVVEALDRCPAIWRILPAYTSD